MSSETRNMNKLSVSVTREEIDAYRDASDRLGISVNQFMRRAAALAIMVDKLRESPDQFVYLRTEGGEEANQHIIPPEKL